VPHTHNGRIYWEEEGQGHPLLMIMGLGFSLKMWRDRQAVRAAPKVERVLLGPIQSRASRIAALPPILYDPHTPRDRIELDLDLLRQNPPRILTVLLQVSAIVRWGCYDRLPQIAAPTLVIHGETDRLVPPDNAKILAERIPGAKLAMLPKAGHIFPTDQPELSREELLKFLLCKSG
jgi:pimeloyl-ACP methyl ester carboxylesterase